MTSEQLDRVTKRISLVGGVIGFILGAIVVGVGYSEALKAREYVGYNSFERVPVPLDEMAAFVVAMVLSSPVAYGVVYGCCRLAAWSMTGFMKDPPE